MNNDTHISLGKEFWQCLPEVLVSLSEVNPTEFRVATPMTDCAEHGTRVCIYRPVSPITA